MVVGCHQSDEWMSDLMVLAGEKDIVSCISCDAIIDSFASLSDQLKRQLLFVQYCVCWSLRETVNCYY
jgi:hypothetical protein